MPTLGPDTTRPGSLALLIAWGGGTAFVGALAWFLYSYLVRFGHDTPGSSIGPPVTRDVVLFSIFALHHSVFARTGVKRAILRVVPPYLERSLYTWIASVLFVATCSWWQMVPGNLYTLPGVWAVAGYAAQACGILVTARGSAALDVLDLAGIRQVLLARAGGQPTHVALQTGGVYRFVRHPLYFGWALLVFGAPHMTATRAVFAIVSTAYLALAIPWEERSLVTIFGEDYQRYRARVRWRMIPGIY